MRHIRMISISCLLLGTLLIASAGVVAQPGTGELKLSVPKTFDLSHVEPEHYAAALGKDPAKIFAFVRDQIGYEVYTGVLRGPRGTLLAMAGNSVDRAALLASLLERSGHRVRYVRGNLPRGEAQKLVDSMWAERALPVPDKVDDEPSTTLKAAMATLEASVKRDYALIREHLKRAKVIPSPESAASLDTLLKEAQEHCWVQWWSNNAWVDLDPSFAEATPGRRYAPVAETHDALPDTLFHRVSIRVRIEEYPILLSGSAPGTPSTREILSYTAKAADLSAKDVVLTHQPENWKGPATSLASALASALENTGRIKPVLIVAEQSVIGQPFYQTPPTNQGVGGVGGLLGGAGTRNPIPVATAETIEFEFTYPGGRRETVVREVFDVVGMAQRAANTSLNAEEVRNRTSAKEATPVTQAVYDIFFTTGRIDALHFDDVEQQKPASQNEPVDERAGLRSINLLFTVASDMLLAKATKLDLARVFFYMDSPRLSITELSVTEQSERVVLDLRRDHARAVSMNPRHDVVYGARVLRGVIDGTLERILMDYLTADIRAKDPTWSSVLSTSSLFEQMQAEGMASLLLPRDLQSLDSKVPPEALARVRAQLASGGGHLVIAPKGALRRGDSLRYAWWRIDPRTGETIAMTDEGLHSSEYPQTKAQRAHAAIQIDKNYVAIIRYERTVRAAGRSGWRPVGEQVYEVGRNWRPLFRALRALRRGNSFQMPSSFY